MAIKDQGRRGHNFILNRAYDQELGGVQERLSRFQSEWPERHIDIGGAIWSYRRTGDSTCPLVMLPGVQGGGDMFFEIGLKLGRQLDMLTVTAPPIVGVRDLADAQAQFLHSLEIPHVDLFGSSLGGYIAQVFTIRYPHLVRRLFLSNTFVDAAPFLATQPPLAAISRMPASYLVNSNLKSMLGAPAFDSGERALHAVLQTLVGTTQSPESYKARVLTLLGAVPVSRVPLADNEVVLIDDDADPEILPQMRSTIRERYRNGRRYTIEHGGHLPAVQRPSAVIDVICAELLSEPLSNM
ncbi:alpha/beta fold hydrolase [Paraburkholderia pallida]|nr:alpha/beta hydrolase [Paraburkholderia pallida]